VERTERQRNPLGPLQPAGEASRWVTVEPADVVLHRVD
jgi:hypothetical protein